MSVEEITLAKRIQMFEESSIYPVVSPEFCNGRAVTDVVAAIMAGGAMILQLRAKHLPDQDLYELAEQCRKLELGVIPLLQCAAVWRQWCPQRSDGNQTADTVK